MERYYIDVTAYYHVHLEEFHMMLHRHPSFEIMYVSDGRCEISFRSQTITLETGQGILIRPDEAHKLTVFVERSCMIANFEFAIRDRSGSNSFDVSDLFQAYPSLVDLFYPPKAYLLFVDDKNYYHSLKDLIDELSNEAGTDPYLSSLLLKRMLIILNTRTKVSPRRSGVHYVSLAKAYIENHYQEEIDIDTIASFAGVHKSYLHRLFKQYEGISIQQYINSKRITTAAFLLLNSNKNIIDIAFSTGFNSRQHFTYTFRHHYGVTPSYFRKTKGSIIEKTDTFTFSKHHHVNESNETSEGPD